jgi:hypothetical protein
VQWPARLNLLHNLVAKRLDGVASAAPQIGQSVGRDVGRQRKPAVARVLPHADCWRREIRVREVAHGNAHRSHLRDMRGKL